jgi:hypothetical protein
MRDRARAELEQAGAALRGSVADLLDHLAHETGDARYRHARAFLMGKPAGRPGEDDADAMALASSLWSSGLARSRRAACHRAALMYSPNRDQVSAMRDRLQRKLRQK